LGQLDLHTLVKKVDQLMEGQMEAEDEGDAEDQGDTTDMEEYEEPSSQVDPLTFRTPKEEVRASGGGECGIGVYTGVTRAGETTREHPTIYDMSVCVCIVPFGVQEELQRRMWDPFFWADDGGARRWLERRARREAQRAEAQQLQVEVVAEVKGQEEGAGAGGAVVPVEEEEEEKASPKPAVGGYVEAQGRGQGKAVEVVQAEGKEGVVEALKKDKEETTGESGVVEKGEGRRAASLARPWCRWWH
jgi:hypothetical protein